MHTRTFTHITLFPCSLRGPWTPGKEPRLLWACMWVQRKTRLPFTLILFILGHSFDKAPSMLLCLKGLLT